GSNGRCNTLLICSSVRVFQKNLSFELYSLRPNQGSVFLESTLSNECVARKNWIGNYQAIESPLSQGPLLDQLWSNWRRVASTLRTNLGLRAFLLARIRTRSRGSG